MSELLFAACRAGGEDPPPLGSPMFPFRIPPLPLILSYFLLGMLLDAPRASIPTQKWGIFYLGRGVRGRPSAR